LQHVGQLSGEERRFLGGQIQVSERRDALHIGR
jgi:hypothetical protein